VNQSLPAVIPLTDPVEFIDMARINYAGHVMNQFVKSATEAKRDFEDWIRMTLNQPGMPPMAAYAYMSKARDALRPGYRNEVLTDPTTVVHDWGKFILSHHQLGVGALSVELRRYQWASISWDSSLLKRGNARMRSPAVNQQFKHDWNTFMDQIEALSRAPVRMLTHEPEENWMTLACENPADVVALKMLSGT
jgi:hypothetical protein